MYCGAKYGLSDEHLIPYALWGNMVLPKSSCEACAAITSKVELKVLRGFMHAARIVGGSPTRRKNRRPETLKQNLILQDEAVISRDIRINEVAGILILPVLVRAGIMAGRAPSSGVTVMATESLNFGKSIADMLSTQDAIGLEGVSQIDTMSFARLLAKIAYGFTVAEEGLFPRDESPVLPLILGQTGDATNWVGSSSGPTPPNPKARHTVQVLPLNGNDGSTGAGVKLRLFANSGCTGYEIAVRIPKWREYATQQFVAADI